LSLCGEISCCHFSPAIKGFFFSLSEQVLSQGLIAVFFSLVFSAVSLGPIYQHARQTAIAVSSWVPSGGARSHGLTFVSVRPVVSSSPRPHFGSSADWLVRGQSASFFLLVHLPVKSSCLLSFLGSLIAADFLSQDICFNVDCCREKSVLFFSQWIKRLEVLWFKLHFRGDF
jgi:hypothetical protein